MHELTRAAVRVMARLNQDVQAFGEYDGAPSEIQIISLLRETGGVAARAFMSLGVDRARLSRDLAAVVPPPRPFDLGEATRRGAVTARYQAFAQRHPYIGTAHSLYGALRDHEGTIAKVLAGHSLTIDQVLDRVDELADADGASEGGTVSPHLNRSYRQWLAFAQSNRPDRRFNGSLQVMSQTQFLTDDEKAAYADAVIPVMKKLLGDASKEIRWNAVKTLAMYARHGREERRPADDVRQALTDRDAVVRLEAAGALWDITRDVSAVLPVLREALAGEDQHARTLACGALGKVAAQCVDNHDEVVELLTRMARSEEHLTALTALRGLGGLGPKARAAVPVVVELLGSADGVMLSNPVSMLNQVLKLSPTEQYIAQLFDTLVKTEPDPTAVVPRLTPFLLVEGRAPILRAALSAIGRLGPGATTALPMIDPHLSDPDPLTRISASLCAWRITADSRHVTSLAGLLGNQQTEVSTQALAALAETGPAAEQALPAIERMLGVSDPRIRVAAAAALKKLGHNSAGVRAALTDLVESTDMAVRVQAGMLLAPEAPGSAPRPAEIRKQWLAAHRVQMLSPTESRVDPEQEAADLWTEAIETDPADAQAYFFRGQAFLRGKRYDEAIPDFARASELEPDNAGYTHQHANAYNLRAIQRKNQRDYDRAIADYTEAIRLWPEHAGVRRNRAKAYLADRRYAEGFADLEQALLLAPSDGKVRNDFAWHLATVADTAFRDPRRALELATRACQTANPPEPYMLSTLAAAHAALGEFDDALRLMDRALEAPDALTPALAEELGRHRDLFRQCRAVGGGGEK